MKFVLKGLLVLLAMTVTAQAKTCKLEISGNDAMKFDKSVLKIKKACTKVKLTLTHSGKLPKTAMGHNWVLVKTSDFSGAMAAAMQAGVAKEYVPAKNVIAATKLVGGDKKGPKKDTIEFSTKGLKKGGDYTYFCGFPGHASMMKGKFIIE